MSRLEHWLFPLSNGRIIQVRQFICNLIYPKSVHSQFRYRPEFFFLFTRMDGYPPKEVMDKIVDVPRISKPVNAIASTKNSVEGFLHVTQRLNHGSSFRGITAVCRFCGEQAKRTVSRWRVHFTKQSESTTHCKACEKVPKEISEWYIERRDIVINKQRAKRSKQLEDLQTAIGEDSSPSSSQASGQSSAKKPRYSANSDPSQPNIIQSLVSPFEFSLKCNTSDNILNRMLKKMQH